MAELKNYHEQKQIDNTLRLREILKTLPPFAKDFFRAIEPRSSARTRINYAYDIRVFFHFLMEVNPVYSNYSISQFTLQDLDRIEPVDIEEYMEYLNSLYDMCLSTVHNSKEDDVYNVPLCGQDRIAELRRSVQAHTPKDYQDAIQENNEDFIIPI